MGVFIVVDLVGGNKDVELHCRNAVSLVLDRLHQFYPDEEACLLMSHESTGIQMTVDKRALVSQVDRICLTARSSLTHIYAQLQERFGSSPASIGSPPDHVGELISMESVYGVHGLCV